MEQARRIIDRMSTDSKPEVIYQPAITSDSTTQNPSKTESPNVVVRRSGYESYLFTAS